MRLGSGLPQTVRRHGRLSSPPARRSHQRYAIASISTSELPGTPAAAVVVRTGGKFRGDAIGLWLAGHEPGNVNLYRTAKERGLSDTVNPREIPVYELPREGEASLHLLDEPFDYDRHKV